ncbi:response regulator transcription factor [Streptomyces cavernicola]|uniref:Response regulator transcription factor n=1 Tax=Streptomyces cavernicola TaxID=3043613 RepID=A0ABT6SFL0_9ACTN|nr:response regulator transcription factor [Streptomyces sp. B-S-A6]MDI3406985.1 response regulator transcription factor [Streptomyces sp. B-S-A6]
MIRVLLADDEDLVRTALRLVLDSHEDIAVVAEVRDGAAAVAAVRTHRPDVVLMDIQMPGTDGLTATREITALPDPPAVLLLTMFGLDAHVEAAVAAHASGFLLKDAEHEELAAAVRAVHRGEAVLAPAVTRRVLDLAHSAVPPVDTARDTGAQRIAGLDEEELAVLTLVGGGHSNAAIGSSLSLSEGAVKRRVSRLLAKLGCDNRVQLAIAAIDAGLVPRG